jgi:hypothetical protein
MEAQQVAEAQRRVAAESARLQQDGQRASADAMRRLAAEKDTLADRVDELQRAAQQLANAGGRAPDTSGRASAAREAAGQLQREQVGQRMRAGANAMRGAAAAGGQSAEQTARREADADRQLARTLDRVADTLGGADQADARQLAERLDQTAGIRERLNRLEQQIREAEARQRSSEAARTQPGQDGRQGREGRGGTTGSGQAGELERLREQYARELQRARETLGRLTAEQQRGGGGSTPEHHEFSRSAPGTESFKQDFSRWASLRKDIDLALERYEAAASERLARKDAGGRLSAGGSDRVPEAYRRPIARYYESLAKVKK